MVGLVNYQLVAELNGGVMVAPLLALAAAAEDADPLEPGLPHLSPLNLNYPFSLHRYGS